MKVYRSPKNPIISPHDVKPSRSDHEVICVFNCGVTRFNNDVLLLLRVAERPIKKDNNEAKTSFFLPEEDKVIVKTFDTTNPEVDVSDSRYIRTSEQLYLTSISHLRVARSTNGIDFTIEDQPCLQASNMYEMYGIEDPRITKIDSTYYINYTAVSPISGITTCLAKTSDFGLFERKGVIFQPDNKDGAIFPEMINGKYYALSRPISSELGLKDMWISESKDLINWGNHRFLMSTRANKWDNGRIGGSAVPFKTEKGWLEIYHGATLDNRYCLGAVLLDLQEPWKVLARSEHPIMQPKEDYEINGFFGNVIFNCGVLNEDKRVKIYYGAADTYIGYAEILLQDILDDLK